MDAESQQKRPVRVTIANHSFTIVTTGDEREVVELAQKVDELIATISAKSGSVDSTRLAILACLHLADRMTALERELRELRSRVESRSRHFQGLLDSIID